MAETEEEMLAWRRNRCKQQRKPREGAVLPPKKKAKVDKQAREKAKRSAAEEILSAAGFREDRWSRVHKQRRAEDGERVYQDDEAFKKLKAKIKRLKAELCAVRSRNDKLQDALYSKIFQTALPGTQENGVEFVASDSFALLSPLPATNYMLLQPAPLTSGVVPPATAKWAPPETEPVLTEDGQVNLGPGVYLARETWGMLMDQPADAAFCKRLAVALWGNETLPKRSVTGRQFNKDISKGKTAVYPPLSPTKLTCMSSAFWYFLKQKGCSQQEAPKRHQQQPRYLAQKCSDLRR
ncbi:BEN domain-containing protein 5-like [Ornithodoros turicata]|uniref:BEN domain-containing protein 5-like n=1 Tax=Ornithodoros turicata TaxID=34597 RepID=UPI0031386ECA